jgi:O-antigen ligase
MLSIDEVLTTSSLTLFILVPLAILYVLTKRGKGRFVRLMDVGLAKKLAIVFPLMAVLALAILGGTGVLAFDDDFGNNRGITWRMGFTLYARMNPFQRLFGIGPDCFAEYLYSFPDLAAICNEQFGNLQLKNAHSEMLTMLVNVGFVGVFAYFGIFATLFVRLVKGGAAKPLLYVPALCIVSYLIHNTVSFTQILNLPFVILVMAVGEAEMRYDYEKINGIGSERPYRIPFV